MNGACLFFNTQIKNSGLLATIGDAGLAPLRDLLGGRTVEIVKNGDDAWEMHHVRSFHKNGEFNRSTSNWKLHSSPTSQIKTLAAIALLIPGLVLSIFKALAYLFADMRQRHALAKEHFTPINRVIGSIAHPINTIQELRDALKREQNQPKHQPTNALVIHGNGQLAINEDPGILRLNPMKLILDGAQIVHRPSAIGRLDDAMWETGKWQVGATRIITVANIDATAINDHGVASVKEALEVQAPRRKGTCRQYHMIFSLIHQQPEVAGA